MIGFDETHAKQPSVDRFAAEEFDPQEARLNAIFDFPISKALGIHVNREDPPRFIHLGWVSLLR